ncbi:MAG: EpsI family protein [Acidobacteriia bacterium]|nr:EpsI family protein [Terriglobia bacterium]
MVLVLTAAGLRSAQTRVPDSLAQPLNSIPANIAGWTKASEEELAPKVLEALKPTSYLNRGYRSGKKGLGLFISYHAQQRAGESIHTPKHCLPGGGWEFSEVGSAYIPFRGSRVKVNRYIVQDGGRRLLILYWYHSKLRVVANEYAAKFYLAHDSIFSRQTAGSIVRITLPDGPSAMADAVEFATALLPYVQACLGSAAGAAESASFSWSGRNPQGPISVPSYTE